MEFTSVLPGVRLEKEDQDGNKEVIFLSQNDRILVKTLDGQERKGISLQIEFARYTEEDDVLFMHKDNGENEGIPFDTIDDIRKESN